MEDVRRAENRLAASRCQMYLRAVRRIRFYLVRGAHMFEA